MCVCNLHEYSEDTGLSLSKVSMEGHMPFLFKVTDEVDTWTDVVHSCLNAHSQTCDFYQHFHFLWLPHPSALVPMWVHLMDSWEIYRLPLIFCFK